MPGLLTALSGVGAVAMLLVGGGILLHGLEVMGVVGPAHLLHDLDAGAGALIPAVSGPALSGLVGWTAASLATTIAGFLVGLALMPAWALASSLRRS
jgi:predicted DNA repair protein MutK